MSGDTYDRLKARLSEDGAELRRQAAQLEAQRVLIGELVEFIEMIRDAANDSILDSTWTQFTHETALRCHRALAKAREVTATAPLRQPKGGE